MPENPNPGQERQHLSTIWLRPFEDLLRIILQYGIPTAAFGAGIYGFLIIIHVSSSIEIKAILAGTLSVVGLLTQAWMFSRENPRIYSNEYTRLVEKMLEHNSLYMTHCNQTQKEFVSLAAGNKPG